MSDNETLRFAQNQWRDLRAILQARTDVETAAIILAEPIGSGVMLVRSVAAVPEDGYAHRTREHITINPDALVALTKPAREHGWSIVTAHSHPLSEAPRFSLADDAGDARLMPGFARQMPERRHGALILGVEDRCTARWYDHDLATHSLRVVVVGDTLEQHWPMPVAAPEERDDRQRLALGAHGLAKLRACHVAVVGAGGLGSLIVQYLAHLGVGAITVIDADQVEATNLPRLVGACPDDVSVGADKVVVAQRYAQSIASASNVRVIPAMLDEHLAEKLASCDMVISAVDRHRPRALLNQLAYRARLPLVDAGIGFRVDAATGELTGGAARTVVAGPGRPCLACWGLLNADRLREEALSPGEREALADEGYLRGVDEPQPAVMAFNGLAASWAVIEVMRLVTGFGDEVVNYLNHQFLSPSTKQLADPETGDCRICGSRAA